MAGLISALGEPTRVLTDGPTVLVYNFEAFKRWMNATPWSTMRKPGTFIQTVEQPGGLLVTLEGSVEVAGGVLCCSVDPAAPEGAVVDPFVMSQGLSGLAKIYQSIDPGAMADPESVEFATWRASHPESVLDPTSVVGGVGSDPEVVAALLARPYVMVRPTDRQVWPAPWTVLCGDDLYVQLDFSWRPRVYCPSAVVCVPGTDDIYFVTDNKMRSDGWTGGE
jgi:hypothetical protein